MTEALIYAILALFIFGTYDYLVVKPARRIPVIPLALYLSLGQFLIFFVLFLLFGTHISLGGELIYPIFAGIFGVTGIIFFSKSVQTGLAGISSSIANAYPLITIFVGALIFKEQIVNMQYVFFISIILGIFFLSFQLSEIKSLKLSQCKSSLGFAFGAMLAWAGFTVLFSVSTEYYGAINTVLIAEFGNILALSLLLIITKQSVIKHLQVIDKKIVLDVGKVLICSLFGVYFFAKAFETGGTISVVSAITASSPIMTTLLARIFLKEKLNVIQYGAMLLLIAGVSGLSYVSL